MEVTRSAENLLEDILLPLYEIRPEFLIYPFQELSRVMQLFLEALVSVGVPLSALEMRYEICIQDDNIVVTTHSVGYRVVLREMCGNVNVTVMQYRKDASNEVRIEQRYSRSYSKNKPIPRQSDIADRILKSNGQPVWS